MKNDIKFEEALELLGDRVKNLESGNLTVDEALTTYEEAIRLVRICSEKLDATEARIRILTESDDGTVTDKPFGTGANEA